MGLEVDLKCRKWVGPSEDHCVMEREHMRVHEENKTEAGKVRWVRPDGLDDVGGPVGRRWGQPDEDGDGRMKMGPAG